MHLSEHRDRLDRLDIGSFIAKNPGFNLNLEEFLLSYKIRETLASRMRAFVDCVMSRDPNWAARDDLRAWLDAGEWVGIPAYRDYAWRSRIEELPTVSKGDLRAYAERYLCPDYVNEMIWLKPTTGSSGTPIRVWYGAEFYFELLNLALPKILFRAGSECQSQRRLFCISISDNHSLPDSIFVDPTEQTGISVQIVVDGSKPETFEPVFRLMREEQPVCISSKPSLLEIVAEIWNEYGGGRSGSSSDMISSGSALLPDLRERLSTLTSGRVINAYAMTEFGLVGSECAHGGLHIDPMSIFVEVLDDHGNVVAPGEAGELVLSSCRNSAMPLLRYRSGDLGVLSSTKCRCGSAAPRIERLDGRKIQCFRLSSGALFPPTSFNDMFSHFPELIEFQVTQRSLRQFAVRVEFNEACQETHDILRQIALFFENRIPGRPEVEVIETHFPHDSKFERYRSDL